VKTGDSTTEPFDRAQPLSMPSRMFRDGPRSGCALAAGDTKPPVLPGMIVGGEGAAAP
jgi:hypothetical protein